MVSSTVELLVLFTASTAQLAGLSAAGIVKWVGSRVVRLNVSFIRVTVRTALSSVYSVRLVGLREASGRSTTALIVNAGEFSVSVLFQVRMSESTFSFTLVESASKSVPSKLRVIVRSSPSEPTC